jgi:hypothetical protein
MFDIVSYILGKKSGEKTVILDSDDYTFSEDGNGNITIKEADDGE